MSAVIRLDVLMGKGQEQYQKLVIETHQQNHRPFTFRLPALSLFRPFGSHFSAASAASKTTVEALPLSNLPRQIIAACCSFTLEVHYNTFV